MAHRMIMLGMAGILLAAARLASGAGVVGVYHQDPGISADYAVALGAPDVITKSLGEAELDDLTADDLAALVLAPGSRFPAHQRQRLDAFVTAGGHLVTMAPEALDYQAPLLDPVTIFDGRGENFSYRIPTGPRTEQRAVELPGGIGGIEYTTSHIGGGVCYLNIPLAAHRRGDRSQFEFHARGGSDVDILYLQLTDEDGRRWISFVDAGADWRLYRVPLGNFLPVDGELQGAGAQPDPERVRELAIGINFEILWREQAGSFGVAGVKLGGSAHAGAPTSAMVGWRVQCERMKLESPDWIIDPFRGRRQLEGGVTVRAGAGQGVVASAAFKPEGPVWEIAPPAPERGVDATQMIRIIAHDELRRIPLLLTDEGEVLAEMRLEAGAGAGRGSVSAFGFGESDFGAHPELIPAVRAAIRYAIASPKILSVTPNTDPHDAKEIEFLLRVQIANPLDQPAAGKLLATAGGTLRGEASWAVEPRSVGSAVVRLGGVPADFPFQRFDWQVELTSKGGASDVMADRVDVMATLGEAARFMLGNQCQHADGRMSHHFYADIYAARALYALARHLEAHPDAAALTPAELDEAVFRLLDLMVDRQLDNGMIPMGYGEDRGIIFIADNGSIVLGLAQLASWIGGERGGRYLEAVRRFFEIHQSFYMSEEKAAIQRELHGADSPGIIPGGYGLGFMGSDYFAKERWPDIRREERGPFWVLPITMGYLGALARLDPEPIYTDTALRDARHFLAAGYTAEGHFHSEGAWWLYDTLPDREVAEGFRALIERDAYKVVFSGREHDLGELQGRAVLRWLTPLYYESRVGRKPEFGNALLKMVWEFGSPTSSFSVNQVAWKFPRAAHGATIGAHRYTAYGALCLMELVAPGSTLLRAGE